MIRGEGGGQPGPICQIFLLNLNFPPANTQPSQSDLRDLDHENVLLDLITKNIMTIRSKIFWRDGTVGQLDGIK